MGDHAHWEGHGQAIDNVERLLIVEPFQAFDHDSGDGVTE